MRQHLSKPEERLERQRRPKASRHIHCKLTGTSKPKVMRQHPLRTLSRPKASCKRLSRRLEPSMPIGHLVRSLGMEIKIVGIKFVKIIELIK